MERANITLVNKAIFLALAVIFVLAVISLTVFVGIKPPKESTFIVRGDKDTVLFGVTPWGDPRLIKEAYTPLLKYLSDVTGKKFQLLVMEDYDVAIDNLADGNIDISVTSPVSYVIAKNRQPGLKYISTMKKEQNGQQFSTYKGYIIGLRAKYKGRTIDDLMKDPSDVRFGFVSRASASGWAYPMAMMKKKGFEPDKEFYSVTTFENHTLLTNAMISGKIDAGATWEYNYDNIVKKNGDIFEILWKSEPIPGPGWVASTKTDPAFVEEIRKIQEKIESDPELKEALLKNTPDKGWQVLDDSFYDSVREVMNSVGEFK